MSKYIFTNENFAPICIAYYQDDTIAEKEGEKLAQEMSQNINVCKVVFSHIPGQYKQVGSLEQSGEINNKVAG